MCVAGLIFISLKSEFHTEILVKDDLNVLLALVINTADFKLADVADKVMEISESYLYYG